MWGFTIERAFYIQGNKSLMRYEGYVCFKFIWICFWVQSIIHKILISMQACIKQFHDPYRACSKIFISRIKNAFCLFFLWTLSCCIIKDFGPWTLPLVHYHVFKWQYGFDEISCIRFNLTSKSFEKKNIMQHNMCKISSMLLSYFSVSVT